MQVRVLSLLLLAGALWVSACTREPPPGPAVAAAPSAQVPSPEIAGGVMEGRRVATRVGCLGCHGKDGSGRKLWGEPDKFQIWSPNITDKRALYDDAGFERLLRAGKTHDGHRALGMPVLMFKYLSDREVRDITAFIRSMQAAANPELQSSTFTAEARREIEGYEDDLAVPPVAAPAEPPLAKLELGKHIAMTSCSECHGPTLDGFEGDSTPPLVVAKAYSKADFERLLRTGVSATGKESQSGLMSEVARDRFATTLSTSELDALKAWLDSR